MSFGKVKNFTRLFFDNLHNRNVMKIRNQSAFYHHYISNRKNCEIPIKAQNYDNFSSNSKFSILLSTGILSFFFGRDDEETPEQKLVTTMKRSILCIQRQEYDKAEQMLHLALRMAQDQQNKNGITYVYDIMANLALEREQFEKAEKLFVDVMRRLFADGYTEDSVKILAISSKIAHIAGLEGHLEKAVQGFKWTLQIIEKKMKSVQDDDDLKELWGHTRNWLGEVLMEQEKYEEAKKCFQDAYEVFTEIHGKVHAEAVTILNNLSVVYTKLDDYAGAKKFLDEALQIVEELPEVVDTGTLKVNLGLIYLRDGLVQQAKEACSLAWRIGKKFENKNVMEQADYCLNAINEMKNKK